MEASTGWRDPIRQIFVSGWLRQLRRSRCPTAGGSPIRRGHQYNDQLGGRLRDTGSCGPANEVIAGEPAPRCLQRARERDFALGRLVAGWPSAALKLTTGRSGTSVHAEGPTYEKLWWPANAITRRRARWTKYQGRITLERLIFI